MTGVQTCALPIWKKFKGLKLSDVPLEDLESYATWLQNTAAKENKPLNAQATDFILRVETHSMNMRKGK